eukprot:260715_1
MGNCNAKLEVIYKSKLKLACKNQNNGKKNGIIEEIMPLGILEIILDYSHATEQIHLIYILFPKSIQDKHFQNTSRLKVILRNLCIIPYFNTKVIKNFNTKYHINVLHNPTVNPHKIIRIYFNTIKLQATNIKLSDLQREYKNFLHYFTFYLLDNHSEMFSNQQNIHSFNTNTFLNWYKTQILRNNFTESKDYKQISDNKFRMD